MDYRIEGDNSYNNYVVLCFHAKKLICEGPDSSFSIIDMTTNQKIKSIYPFSNNSFTLVSSIYMSPDGILLTIIDSANQLTVVNINKEKEIKKIKTEYQINAVSITPDNRYLFVGGSNDILNIYNLNTGSLEKSMGGGNTLAYYLGNDNSVTSIAIDSGSNYAAIANLNSIKFYNIRSGTIEKEYNIKHFIKTMVYVDENHLLFGNSDGVFNLCNLLTDEIIISQKGHDCAIEQITLSPDKLKAVTFSADGLLCLWDIKKGLLLSKFVLYDNGEWLFLTPEGYFNASSEGTKFLNISESPSKVTGIDGDKIQKYFNPRLVSNELN